MENCNDTSSNTAKFLNIGIPCNLSHLNDKFKSIYKDYLPNKNVLTNDNVNECLDEISSLDDENTLGMLS